MEDEDGTCLLDVLCDPQALNDFLHGTNELQAEDLLLNSASGEPSIFTDAPSPVSLLGDGRDSPGTPPAGCVDLSFLEEALLSSPEAAEDPRGAQVGPPAEEKNVEVEEEACDILQQSLQEAEITEQTMALEAGLAPPGDGLSLYPPTPLLSPPTIPFMPKPVTLPVRDTQTAVEPPQPSLLAVGPGCPSLKPAAPPQLMGLLPGNVFPAGAPEASFSLSPAQGSSMIIHKAAGRPLITPAVRAPPAPGIILQRAPLPIQPKLPISIQPRLVQISPKPPGQKAIPGLNFVPGTASPNIVLSQAPSQKAAAAQAAQQLPKPVSLQLVNQGSSFVLQPQGLFQGQNQFLLPGQSPVTISQPAGAAQPLQGPSFHSMAPSAGQLVDGPQIVAVPQRQLNLGPVFTTPTGQLALRHATVLSGALQLQSAPAAVFQMPTQLAGTYTPGGAGQRATLLHSPALGNHITLINSSGVLPSDLTSISIVNGPSLYQGIPFAAQTPVPQTGGPDGQLSLQQASVVLLPERSGPQKRNTPDDTFHQLQQPLGAVVQHESAQNRSAGLQSSPPPVLTVLQPPPEPALDLPKLLVPPAEESALNQNPAFGQRLQEQALRSPIQPDFLVGTLEPLASPAISGKKATPLRRPASVQSDDSPLPSEPEDPPLHFPMQDQDSGKPTAEPLSPSAPPPDSSAPEPQDEYPSSHQHPGSQSHIPQNQLVAGSAQTQMQSSSSQPMSSSHSPAPSVSVPQQQPGPAPAVSSERGDESAVPQHNKSTAALLMGCEAFTLDPPSPAPQEVPVQGGPEGPIQTVLQPQDPEEEEEEELTPAIRRQRFQQQLLSDHRAVQNPVTRPAFGSLKDALRHLLPYHACAGHLPTQQDFILVDRQFDSMSYFLLKRTKDMVNKYRQLLVKEAQQESPSAEMVMLERLFLQAERFSLAEDRRRARRDPETFMTALATSSGPSHPQSSGSPLSPPSWTRLSERPPGLKTYRSSSRGALRLTIKQESGSRKVVHNSACGPRFKRDHAGQLTNGGGAPNGALQVPNGALSGGSEGQRGPAPSPPSEPEDVSDPRDAPGLKRYRSESPALPGGRFSPLPPPLQEDSVLSEHLQSAIDSILELQRLQGPAGPRAAAGPSLDQAVASILEGRL